jgi:hypothetical protein
MEKTVIQALIYLMVFTLGWLWGMQWSDNIEEEYRKTKARENRGNEN